MDSLKRELPAEMYRAVQALLNQYRHVQQVCACAYVHARVHVQALLSQDKHVWQ